MRPFEATEATQNVAMDGTAKSITIGRPSDVECAVNIVVIGTQTVFVRLDGTVPTTTNAKPLLANTDSTLWVSQGVTTVRLIGAAGSTAYVTPGRGM